MQLEELRRQHPVFVFEMVEFGFEANQLKAQFHYTLEPGIHFTTSLTFHDLSAELWQKLDQQVVKNWLLHIGMVEGLSYWKAACSPEFVVKAGYLNESQLQFWLDLLHKGMSEFFFINHIDGWAPDFVTFKVDAADAVTVIDQTPHQARALVPVGGGKDSAVALEILKKSSIPVAPIVINPNPQVENVLAATQLNSKLTITRQLDPQILELNDQGYLNGHTPFSAMAAFVTTLAAYLYDYQWVALSNEYSANEGNVTFLGQNINHQYSKTLDFERKFREYCRTSLSTTIEYFSFLRPLHELQIAQLFAQLPQYFSVFLSCNRGQKTGQWCGECPKCLFVYVMLSPFLEPNQVEDIFSQNLLSKAELQPILEELAGVVECKSLECVGTRQETLYALALTLEKYHDQDLPVLLQWVRDRLITTEKQPELVTQAQAFLQSFQTDHCLPANFVEVLRAALPKNTKL